MSSLRDVLQGIHGTAAVGGKVDVKTIAVREKLRPSQPRWLRRQAMLPPPMLSIPAGANVQRELKGHEKTETFTGQSPAPASSFAALADNGTQTPPDTDGAVGPNHLVVALNTGVLVQDHSGNTVQSLSLNGFWSGLGGKVTAFDPRVLYDPYAQRWLMSSGANPNSSNSEILVAASESADPTGAWTEYSIRTDSSGQTWADFPRLGFNGKWVVLTANIYTTGATGAFLSSRIFAIDKTSLYAGTSLHWTKFNGDLAYSEIPAVTYDPTEQDEFLVCRWSGASGALRLAEVAGAVGSEVFGTVSFPSAAAWSDFPPDSADFEPQNGSSNKIDAGDSRVQSVIYRNGSIWCAHHIFLPASSPARSSVQWWQISSSGRVQQRGLIDDPTGATDYAYPSIAVNVNNDVLLGYSRFSGQSFAAAAYSFRNGSDPPDSMNAGAALKTGEAAYYKLNSKDGHNRWGDYSASAVDPVNDTDLWTIQEYAASPQSGTDRWGTWWGRIAPGGTPPPDESTPVVESLSAELRLDTLTLTGTAADSGGDISQGQVTLLDGDGNSLSQKIVALPNAGGTSVNFSIDVSGMAALPTAVSVSVILIDAGGRSSQSVTTAFSNADPGGPNVKTASYNETTAMWVIKGSRFTSDIQLEINGRIVTPSSPIKIKPSGSKIKAAGSMSDLNLSSGPNRIRVIHDGLNSNIFILQI